MKKIIFALLLVLALASTASAANFIEIRRDTNYIISIDVDSIRDHGSYYTVWVRYIHIGEASKDLISQTLKKQVSYSMVFAAYNKSIPQSQTLTIVAYDTNYNVIFNDNNQLMYNGWLNIVPGSYGHSIMEAIYTVMDKAY